MACDIWYSLVSWFEYFFTMELLKNKTKKNFSLNGKYFKNEY